MNLRSNSILWSILKSQDPKPGESDSAKVGDAAQVCPSSVNQIVETYVGTGKDRGPEFSKASLGARRRENDKAILGNSVVEGLLRLGSPLNRLFLVRLHSRGAVFRFGGQWIPLHKVPQAVLPDDRLVAGEHCRNH